MLVVVENPGTDASRRAISRPDGVQQWLAHQLRECIWSSAADAADCFHVQPAAAGHHVQHAVCSYVQLAADAAAPFHARHAAAADATDCSHVQLAAACSDIQLTADAAAVSHAKQPADAASFPYSPQPAAADAEACSHGKDAADEASVFLHCQRIHR